MHRPAKVILITYNNAIRPRKHALLFKYEYYRTRGKIRRVKSVMDVLSEKSLEDQCTPAKSKFRGI